MATSDVISALKDLSPLTQLFAAIYFSLCFEGLANKLYSVKEMISAYDDVFAQIRLYQNRYSAYYTLLRTAPDYCIPFVNKCSFVGFLVCILVLFATGIVPLLHLLPDSIVPVCFWLILFLMYLPFVLCSLIYWLVKKVALGHLSKVQKRLENVSRQEARYVTCVINDKMDDVNSQELKDRFLHGGMNKCLEGYLKDIEDWKIERVRRTLDESTPIFVKFLTGEYSTNIVFLILVLLGFQPKQRVKSKKS